MDKTEEIKPAVLAIIPARGGSKGIPGKNMADLCGKPLIAWTIEAALASGVFDRAVVTTDDHVIAKFADSAGAEVPFMRPAELAADDTPAVDVVEHTLCWLRENQNYEPDYLMLLQPTSPLRNAEDIRGAWQHAMEKDADAVVSVCEAQNHPYLTKSIDADRMLCDFLPAEPKYATRQAMPRVFALNGAIYLIRTDVFLANRCFHPEKTYAWVMPPERSIDVDSPWDLHLVNLILKDRRVDAG